MRPVLLIYERESRESKVAPPIVDLTTKVPFTKAVPVESPLIDAQEKVRNNINPNAKTIPFPAMSQPLTHSFYPPLPTLPIQNAAPAPIPFTKAFPAPISATASKAVPISSRNSSPPPPFPSPSQWHSQRPSPSPITKFCKDDLYNFYI